MKKYLTFAAVLALSFGMSSVALAHGGGGGGGGHSGFGGGGMHGGFGGGGGHFGGGGHSFNSGHFGGGRAFGHDGHDHFFHGRSGAFFGGGWPFLYDGGGYGDLDYTSGYTGPGDSAVAAVQDALARNGFYHGPIDGDLDLITQDAMESYERAHRLPVRSTISDELLNSLGLE